MKDTKVPYLPQDVAACTNQACALRAACWRSNPHPDAKHQVFTYFITPTDTSCPHQITPPEPR